MRHEGRPAPRRLILAAALLGAAITPARAEDAVMTEEIAIPGDGGDIVAFRAMPARAGPFPLVLVAGDEAGRPAWVAGLCRDLASRGAMAIGVDALGGASDPSDEAVVARLDAAFRWGKQHAGDPGRTALIGYGRSGRIAWLYAAQTGWLKAAVAWGGALEGSVSASQSRTPLEVAAQLKAPLMGIYGKDDASNPPSLLLKIESMARGRAELVAYVDRAADFAIEGRPAYDRFAAQDAWEKMLSWLKRHGVV